MSPLVICFTRIHFLTWGSFRLLDSSKDRRVRLEDARNFSQFIQDHEDEEAWLMEKQFICKAGIFAKDLRAVLSLQQKHKVRDITVRSSTTNDFHHGF